MHAAIVVGLKVDSRKGAGINAVVGSSGQSSRHGRYYVARGSCERMKNMFSLCCPGGQGHDYNVQTAEEFIVVPRFILLQMWPRLAMGDVEMTGAGACRGCQAQSG